MKTIISPPTQAIIVLICLLGASVSKAQRSKDSQLEDSLFAWQAFTPLNPSQYPWTISPAKQKLPLLFFDWIKESHQLAGSVSNSFGVAEPNKKDKVSTYCVGAFAGTYTAMWDQTGKKVVRMPHTENPIQILSNYIIDAEPVRMLTKADRPVFMRRSGNLEETFKGDSRRTELIKKFDLQNHPQIGKYNVQYYGCEDDLCQPLVAVYIAPNNTLPIKQLTRGQVLKMIEEAMPAEIALAKSKLKSTYGHRPESLEEEYKRFDQFVLPRWKGNLNELRKKYSNSLYEPALTANVNSLEMIQIFNGDDIFENKQSEMFGFYSYEQGVIETSKKDEPLWICISWKPADLERDDFQSRELHRSMVTHFDFDYVYNYFFAKEKVKGLAYTVRNPDIQKSNSQRIANSKPVAAKVNIAGTGSYLQDDFSSNLSGDKPKGWHQPNVGTPSLVTEPTGLSGKWVVLGQHKLTPNSLPKPLPDNFRMEFDVACEHFENNTGPRLQLNINNKVLTKTNEYTHAATPVNINFSIMPGNAKWETNPTGNISLKAEYKDMPPTVRYADNPMKLQNSDFSNKNNKAHIVIEKKGNKVYGYINDSPLEKTAKDKYGKEIQGFNELPANTLFTTFEFQNSKTTEKLFISNIKISAL